jgi:hypothetical protein
MPIASTAEEYWNSEPEDSGLSYLDLMNCLPLPSTIGGGFSEVENSSAGGVRDKYLALETTTTTAGNLILSDTADAEDMDAGWPLRSSGPSEAPASAYNFDFMPTSDSYNNMDSFAHFRLNPTVSTAHSPRPELFLPLPLSAIDSSPPDSPKLMPQGSLPGPINPNKRLRISDLTEENILPDHERRKRSKPDRLTL